jgi:hypothetical protein
LSKLDAGAFSVFMGAPVLADVDRIVTSIDIAAGAQVIAAQPATPCNLTLTLTDADDSVTATIVIVGLDPMGRAVTETAQITLGTGKVWVGTKIFVSVTSITVSALSGEVGGDALTAGVGSVIGLPFDIDDADAVQAVYVDNTKVTPAAIATGESTSGINASGATYDGAKLMWAIVKPAYVGV